MNAGGLYGGLYVRTDDLCGAQGGSRNGMSGKGVRGCDRFCSSGASIWRGLATAWFDWVPVRIHMVYIGAWTRLHRAVSRFLLLVHFGRFRTLDASKRKQVQSISLERCQPLA